LKAILVDDISSIGESYFSFKYKGKVIVENPFICKSKPEYGIDSSYHFNEEDLTKIERELDEGIYPHPIFKYSAHVGYKEYKHLTKEQYIALMKYRFYQVTKLGKVPELLSVAGGKRIEDVIIQWDESQPGIKKPGFVKD